MNGRQKCLKASKPAFVGDTNPDGNGLGDLRMLPQSTGDAIAAPGMSIENDGERIVQVPSLDIGDHVFQDVDTRPEALLVLPLGKPDTILVIGQNDIARLTEHVDIDQILDMRSKKAVERMTKTGKVLPASFLV